MSIKSAREYRAEAERVRKLADSAHLSEHRDSLLTIAAQYEGLAQMAEELRPQHPRMQATLSLVPLRPAEESLPDADPVSARDHHPKGRDAQRLRERSE